MLRKFEQEEIYMNTRINIQVYSSLGTVGTQEKIQRAFNCFDTVVKKYTRFDPKSELSKLNNSGGKPFKVSRELFDLISYMKELSEVTQGIYDPTIIDLLEAFGYKPSADFKELEDPFLYDKIQAMVKSRPSPKDIKLDKEKLEITLARRQRLDLGSIGKGYAIDLAYEALEETEAFIINAGGDIRVKGPKPDGSPFFISLFYSQLPNKKLHRENSIGTIELEEGSVCSSGGWARKVKFFHHLINPKTGFPINQISQSYVIAPTAVVADAWSTVLFIMGKPGLKILPEGVRGIVINAKGEISQSK